MAAVLAGDKLLIDGGLVAYVAKTPTYGTYKHSMNDLKEYLFISSFPDNRTWIIDLSESWTNDSVQPVSIVRPATYVPLELGTLWYYPETNTIFSFGGELSQDGYVVKSGTPGNSGVPADAIWQFEFGEDNTTGIWSQVLGPQGEQAFPTDIKRSLMGATAADSNSAYYIGAQTHFWSTDKVDNMTLHNVPGLLQFDFANATLTNSTNDGSYFASTRQSMEYTPSAVAGMMTYVPFFGTQGVFVTVGGFQIVDADTGQTNQWWHNVTIFDPSHQSWYYQRATGDIPQLIWAKGDYIGDERLIIFALLAHGTVSCPPTTCTWSPNKKCHSDDERETDKRAKFRFWDLRNRQHILHPLSAFIYLVRE